MSKKVLVLGGRMPGRAAAHALVAALSAKGFEAEEVALHHNEHVDIPEALEVRERSAHPQGKRKKPKKRKLKRKGGSKL